MRTRQTSRKTITLPGRYFTGLGSQVDVTLTELSVGGCRFPASGKKLIPGAPLQIYIGASGPHRANIRWSENGEVGVTFATPLSEEQLGRLQDDQAAAASAPAPPGEGDDLPGAMPHRFC
ncbi:PilZ domain-containing protein [Erythrobacter rubeus]|uniref:PilZ domain-containing protein n=1 Tax=Erythrobacter rubeus TaxID=2760803 RepID=A0ABR8KV30_9SPHN|nr:PilZ domain-containing protein [Erythrobacter rubeus]MBD2842943.1 PilZ domain-containing protein [Erythrobacter rubeus]